MSSSSKVGLEQVDVYRPCGGGSGPDRYESPTQSVGLRYGIIEVTTRCQLRCPGCYMVRRDALNKGTMAFEQAVRILDLCREYVGQELETMDILGGEPLLWPDLKQYIEVLLSRGIKPWVFTNMLAITPQLARWLYERRVPITGKLNVDPSDAHQLALQAQLIGSTVPVAKAMIERIEVFRDAGYQAPLFRLQNLVRRDNIQWVPDYYRWCLIDDIGTDLELMGSGECIGAEYWQIAPTPPELAQMIERVQAVRRGFGLKPAEVLMPHVFGSCPFYDKGLYFAVDGHIRSCSNSTQVLARVTDPDPIRAAWESPLLCRRRALTQENVGQPCHSCSRWQKCRGGCRATVEGMGDPFAGYTLCPVPLLK